MNFHVAFASFCVYIMYLVDNYLICLLRTFIYFIKYDLVGVMYEKAKYNFAAKKC